MFVPGREEAETAAKRAAAKRVASPSNYADHYIGASRNPEPLDKESRKRMESTRRGCAGNWSKPPESSVWNDGKEKPMPKKMSGGMFGGLVK